MPTAFRRCRIPLAVLLAASLAAACARGGAGSAALRPDPSPPAAGAAPPRDLPNLLLHTVQPGETLWRISRAYGADLEELIVVNNLGESARIDAGQTLVIPAPHRLPPPGPLTPEREERGSREERRRERESGERDAEALLWPLHGAVQSGFGPRGRRHHDGIDIDGRRGDPIQAAADGRVAFAGLRGAYGKTVIIDHGDGLSTLYAHADELRVRRGVRVRAGETIARVGRTGNAHGTHLHFEVWVERRPVDPLGHLPLESARAGSAR